MLSRYREDKHRDIHVSKYVCHHSLVESLHRVTYDQKIANDIKL